MFGRMNKNENKGDLQKTVTEVDIRNHFHIFGPLKIPRREKYRNEKQRYNSRYEQNILFQNRDEHHKRHSQKKGEEEIGELSELNMAQDERQLFLIACRFGNSFGGRLVETVIDKHLQIRHHSKEEDIQSHLFLAEYSDKIRVDKYGNQRIKDSEGCHKRVVFKHTCGSQTIKYVAQLFQNRDYLQPRHISENLTYTSVPWQVQTLSAHRREDKSPPSV